MKSFGAQPLLRSSEATSLALLHSSRKPSRASLTILPYSSSSETLTYSYFLS
ncbi:MAG: hypothetical protein RQ862_06250 [Candidatus Caldarchaeales archaeon]|nr:hypothetical protein [Candidatus Caldarchaeales archaeon]